MKYKHRATVGKRQMYRRVSQAVTNILDNIKSSESYKISLKRVPVNQNITNNYTLLTANISTENESPSCKNSSNSDFRVCSVSDFTSNEENVPVSFQSFDFRHELSIFENEEETNLASDFKLKEKLRNWAISSKVTRSALTDLLHILSPIHPELPLDSRTLLLTPRQIKFTEITNGKFVYLGLGEGIIKISSQCLINFEQINTIKLSFNVDGLPLFHSTNLQLWPILCLITNFKTSPFPVAIFCGTSKPQLETFFEEFVNELKVLLQEGLLVNNKKYKIEIHSFICDAPAKAFIKCIKSHNGYSGCDKCVDGGEYVQNRIVFRSISATRRSDTSFLLQQDEEHHIGLSPLSKLNIGLVSSFPIDYMHACCLGVVRKLLNFWLGGNLETRLPSRLVNKLSERMISLRHCFPLEFNRKPRGLDELQRWKATELRTFVLYLGPFVLKNIVNIAVYEHFLLLHSALSILISKTHIANVGCNFANELLHTFVIHCEHLYGLQFLIYNVHMLCHLSTDAEIYGSLDTISAFPFENYLGQLKNLIKSPTEPLSQICRRLHEIGLLHDIKGTDDNIKYTFEHLLGPIPNFINKCNCKQFKKLTHPDFVLKIYSYSKADAYCLLNENIVIEIHNIITVPDSSNNDVFIVGKQFKSYESFYTYPFESKYLSICKVIKLTDEIQMWSVNNIKGKCMLFPINDQSYLSLPLIHSIL